MTNDRVRVLLIVAMALAAIQFLLIPWIQYRSELREEVQALTKRLDRSESVLKNKDELKASSQKLEATSGPILQFIPAPENEEAFRLVMQQSVSSMVGESGSTLSVFDWAFSGAVEGTDIRFVRARMTVIGDAPSLAKLQTLLDVRLANAVVRDWSLVAEGEVARGALSRSYFNAVIDFHYELPASGVKP
jgi:hypothetical protein